MKILIVEDNELDLKLFRKVLHHRGFKTIGARNGAEGIVIAAEEQPALILMDMHMPGIDGMEAKDILKKDPLTKNIPLIAISYNRIEAPHKIGFDKCITKPVDLKEFLRVIDETIGGGTAAL